MRHQFVGVVVQARARAGPEGASFIDPVGTTQLGAPHLGAHARVRIVNRRR